MKPLGFLILFRGTGYRGVMICAHANAVLTILVLPGKLNVVDVVYCVLNPLLN